MKRRILYVGIFLAGALLMGAGGGIALAEYSSFEYLGERVLGQEHMGVTQLMAERNPELPFTVRGGGWDQGKVEFVVDDTVPDDRLIFQVEYNDQAITPYIDKELTKLDPEVWEETESWLSQEEGDGTEAALEGETPAAPEPPALREDFFLWAYVDNDLTSVWQAKDELLADLKARSFHTYDVSYWGTITVRMSEKAAGDLVNWQAY